MAKYHSTISYDLAAAAPHSSQMFALVGALILIPIIITYTIVSYWVFRDKVRVGDEGYH